MTVAWFTAQPNVWILFAAPLKLMGGAMRTLDLQKFLDAIMKIAKTVIAGIMEVVILKSRNRTAILSEAFSTQTGAPARPSHLLAAASIAIFLLNMRVL